MVQQTSTRRSMGRRLGYADGRQGYADFTNHEREMQATVRSIRRKELMADRTDAAGAAGVAFLADCKEDLRLDRHIPLRAVLKPNPLRNPRQPPEISSVHEEASPHPAMLTTRPMRGIPEVTSCMKQHTVPGSALHSHRSRSRRLRSLRRHRPRAEGPTVRFKPIARAYAAPTCSTEFHAVADEYHRHRMDGTSSITGRRGKALHIGKGSLRCTFVLEA